MYVVGTQPELTLTSITAPMHGGTYNCIVVNDAGFDHDSGTLYVLPTIVQDPVDTFTRDGETISLTCLAESFPYPTYQWQMMNRDSGVYEDIPGETEAVLTLFSVQFNDYGRYRCVATNIIDGIERTVNSSSALVTGKQTLLACCINLIDLLEVNLNTVKSIYHLNTTMYLNIRVGGL